MPSYIDLEAAWSAGPPPTAAARQALALSLALAAASEGILFSMARPFAPFVPWERLGEEAIRSILSLALSQAGVEAPFSIQRPDDEGEALGALPGLAAHLAPLAFPDPVERIRWLTDGLTEAGRFQYLDPGRRRRLEGLLFEWYQTLEDGGAPGAGEDPPLRAARDALLAYGALWDADIARRVDSAPLSAPPARLLYTQARRLDLREYGILVPLLGSRPDGILADLRAAFGELPRSRRVEANALEREDLERVHTPAYLDVLLGEDPAPAILHAYELIDAQGHPNRYDPSLATRPFTELVQRALIEATGTLMACEDALAGGFAHFLGGGMHHALAGEGRGFCLLHDVLIAIRALQAYGRIRTAWVIDTDCHKGDGTAALTVGDPSISTLSIHMARGWPLIGPALDPEGHLMPAYTPSTVDVPMPVGAEDDYLSRLDAGLGELAYLSEGPLPELAVVVAGSDPSALDVLQSAQGIRLSLPQLLERDQRVYHFLAARGIPQAWVLAGGYGPEVWRVHAQFLRWALTAGG